MTTVILSNRSNNTNFDVLESKRVTSTVHTVCPGLNANTKYFLRFFKKLKYEVENDVYEKKGIIQTIMTFKYK